MPAITRASQALPVPAPVAEETDAKGAPARKGKKAIAFWVVRHIRPCKDYELALSPPCSIEASENAGSRFEFPVGAASSDANRLASSDRTATGGHRFGA
jgi:hypothetical protein